MDKSYYFLTLSQWVQGEEISGWEEQWLYREGVNSESRYTLQGLRDLVSKNKNWTNIHPEFIDEKIVDEWIEKGFTAEDCSRTAFYLKDNLFKVNDYDFCYWIMNRWEVLDNAEEFVKGLRLSENIKQEITDLRNEYDQEQCQIQTLQNLTQKNPSSSTKRKLSFHSQTESEAKKNKLDHQNWRNINSNFTPEIIQEWTDYDFSYEQCANWININSPNRQTQAIHRAQFYAWLQYFKQKDSEWLLNHGNEEALNQEFINWLIACRGQSQTQIEQPPK